MTVKSKTSFALATALGVSLIAGPALADPPKPRFGSDPVKHEQYTHNQVRKQQVRQTERAGGPFKALFNPLTSAWNKYTR